MIVFVGFSEEIFSKNKHFLVRNHRKSKHPDLLSKKVNLIDDLLSMFIRLGYFPFSLCATKQRSNL